MVPAGNRFILSETKGSPASAGPAETILTRKSIAAIDTWFNDTITLRLLPRDDFRDRKLKGLDDHTMNGHCVLHPSQGGKPF